MIRIQLRLIGGGKRTSDSHIRVPRIPVKGDQIAVAKDNDDDTEIFVVEDTTFQYRASRNIQSVDGGQHPHIDQDTEPYLIFVRAKRYGT